jgi:hypothetical protein
MGETHEASGRRRGEGEGVQTHHQHQHQQPRRRRWSEGAYDGGGGGGGSGGWGSSGGGFGGFSTAGDVGVYRVARSSITTLGVGPRGTPPGHPAHALLEVIAPPAPPLPQDEGWTLRGKVRGVRNSSSRSPGGGGGGLAAASRAGGGGAGGGGGGGSGGGRGGRGALYTTTAAMPAVSAERITKTLAYDEGAGEHADAYNEGDESSVLSTLHAAGDTVLLMSLQDRKALFEAAVRELTRRLFHTRHDGGVVPRVTVDVDLEAGASVTSDDSLPERGAWLQPPLPV